MGNFLGLQYLNLKKAKEAEERRKFPLEQRIRESIVGQEGAITTVASGRCYSALWDTTLTLIDATIHCPTNIISLNYSRTVKE